MDDHVNVTGWPTNAFVDAGESVTVGGPVGGVAPGDGEPFPPQALRTAQLIPTTNALSGFDDMAAPGGVKSDDLPWGSGEDGRPGHNVQG